LVDPFLFGFKHSRHHPGSHAKNGCVLMLFPKHTVEGLQDPFLKEHVLIKRGYQARICTLLEVEWYLARGSRIEGYMSIYGNRSSLEVEWYLARGSRIEGYMSIYGNRSSLEVEWYLARGSRIEGYMSIYGNRLEVEWYRREVQSAVGGQALSLGCLG
jgi:hypothetical protein